MPRGAQEPALTYNVGILTTPSGAPNEKLPLGLNSSDKKQKFTTPTLSHYMHSLFWKQFGQMPRSFCKVKAYDPTIYFKKGCLTQPIIGSTQSRHSVEVIACMLKSILSMIMSKVLSVIPYPSNQPFAYPCALSSYDLTLHIFLTPFRKSIQGLPLSFLPSVLHSYAPNFQTT